MKARAPARGWRRFAPSRRALLWGTGGGFLLVLAVFGVAYARTSVPGPGAVAMKQATLVYYSDGRTLIGRIGSVDRTDVPLRDVPVHVRQAVLAAEDRNFYHEHGISPTGVLRALWVDVRGGDVTQGGSTITQQYAKNAFLTQQRTLTRKVKEVFIALKLDQQWSKDQLLQAYLNTIYFGRGAYGIQAAAHAYFATDVQHLDVAQGAVLAGLIQSPGNYDPRVDRSAAERRWHYVVDGMRRMHWLTDAQAAALRFPYVAPRQLGRGAATGPNGFIIDQVKKELAVHGIDESQLNLGGFRVVTTIDRRNQAAAVKAVDDVLASRMDQQAKLRTALVAVKPGDGAIRAMYGGRDYGNPNDPKGYYNFVYDERQPGSSFKPYTLVAALEDGIGLNTPFDGTSPKHVSGYGKDNLVRNDHNEQCRYPCTLLTATARSINTVFVPLAVRVGPQAVQKVAEAAGVRSIARVDQPNAGITLGIYDVTPLDQAVGFATIAAGGVMAQPYLVDHVTDNRGRMVYRVQRHTTRAFPADVAADADHALQQVLDNPQGTASGKGLTGRPAAGKTGTTTNSVDAWFIGFTPQLSTAVWVGNYDHSSTGLYGGTLPASAWQDFMDRALSGAPVVDFPAPAFIGGSPTATTSPTTAPASPTTSPSPSPSPSPSGSATASPTASPTPSPTPSLTQAASPSPTSSVAASTTAQPPG